MINIGRKKISADSTVFIIAEAGVNHNGNLKLAKKLIDAAARAGVDAVKFQTFDPETLVIKNADKAKYQSKNDRRTGEGQYSMLKRLILPRKWHKELKQYSESKGLIFLSTPFSLDDAIFLRKLGIKAIKVGSSDTENIPYLAEIAKWNLPIILSTGMSALPEIKETVKTIRKAGNNKLIVLHCTTNYPTPHEEINLRAITTLKKEFKNIPIGFSDHTLGIEAPIAAVALGAKVIEKHLTLDKNLSGPDHKASLEPEELKKMVMSIRNIEKAMGNGKKIPFSSEQKIANVVRKSIVALKEIKKGETFTKENVDIKRPGTGLSPKHYFQIIGAVAKNNIKTDGLIKKSDYDKKY